MNSWFIIRVVPDIGGIHGEGKMGVEGGYKAVGV